MPKNEVYRISNIDKEFINKVSRRSTSQLSHTIGPCSSALARPAAGDPGGASRRWQVPVQPQEAAVRGAALLDASMLHPHPSWRKKSPPQSSQRLPPALAPHASLPRPLRPQFALDDHSATVLLGSTRVLAVIASDLEAPYPDRPSEGSIRCGGPPRLLPAGLLPPAPRPTPTPTRAISTWPQAAGRISPGPTRNSGFGILPGRPARRVHPPTPTPAALPATAPACITHSTRPARTGQGAKPGSLPSLPRLHNPTYAATPAPHLPSTSPPPPPAHAPRLQVQRGVQPHGL
jgi:hypothetical protein